MLPLKGGKRSGGARWSPGAPTLLGAAVVVGALGCAGAEEGEPRVHDLVILGGQVLDPESGRDEVTDVGIDGGVVRTLGDGLRGVDTIQATGLVAAPGFIDLHAHGQDSENYAIYALDGVTTALELESGTAHVGDWYRERDGGQLVNYGVGVGHSFIRMEVMDDPGPNMPSGDAAHREAAPDEILMMQELLERGLREGAVSVGLQIQNTPAASRWEILELFQVAAAHQTPVHVHLRHMGLTEPFNSINALQEVLAASAVTGAPLHVLHVHSMGLAATGHLLRMIGGARARGMDVTTEAYPYTAGMTGIESAVFDPGWQEVTGIGYEDLEWPETGERLTAETFREYRRRGGSVILHFIPEEMMQAAIASPLTAIISDGRIRNGRGHPRTAGTYARVLGRFVRDEGRLELIEAIRKMTLVPAQRLEARVPGMERKGRIRVGADADLTIFDPRTVADQSTYEDPDRPPVGIEYVLVGGEPVVWQGSLRDRVKRGRPVRGTVQSPGGS